MNLLPYPRSLQRRAGFYTLPAHSVLHLDAALPRDTVLLPVAERLQDAVESLGCELELVTGPARHPRLAIAARQGTQAPEGPDGYALEIDGRGIRMEYRQAGGLRAAVATLRQLLRQYGRRLPRLAIRDSADFARRGVMLDISRGRVPNLETLLELVDHLADFKINEFQLYTEHTFAYRDFEPVWHGWGPITGEEILVLDARCRQMGIDLVPNQNSFGHLRYWLEYPPLSELAEVSEPYEGAGGTFLRYPTTLAPKHPGTLPFLRQLYDELLPHFSSRRFNVGCDETWDLGRGQSKEYCEAQGKDRVYVDFLKQIYREVSDRDRQMMFWGDIILNHPQLLPELPKDIIALNWGYEANHPFERETSLFAESRLPFYVCPGTSTWMSLIGRHDNAFTNLRLAAEAGRKQGAQGYLNTDWGDGGHPQPLAVSYLPYLLGAAVSWCGESFDEKLLVPVLSRDVFGDPTQRTAKAALALGFAHRKFNYFAPNVTPYGTVVTAPPPKWRELVCRDGLKYYARIPDKNIRAALEEVEKHRAVLYRSRPSTHAGEVLTLELDMAARMAAQSCHILLWQQALAAGKPAQAKRLAKTGIRALGELEHDFEHYWPLRNKGTPEKCSAFLRWRMDDYRRGVLHYPPEAAQVAPPKTNAAE
ncbi:MAG TPA: glycoside hydrolase family 20 zincin-like fold domain-containing protein [Bacillota bacterium]|nr:glycoside hydrolase family 20 zincin-like fold domain-containing protein [Bacillota bacterium]